MRNKPTLAIRIAIAVLLAVPPLSMVGCKDEGKPNSELKVPEIPESGSAAGKGDMSKSKKK